MKLLDRTRNAFNVLCGRVETRSVVTSALEELLMSGMETDAGVDVTVENSLGGSAVLCAVRNIAESFAMLPGKVFERIDPNDDRKRAPAKKHPLYRLLTIAPNPDLTPFEFWEWGVVSALMRGNFYAQKIYDRGGRLRELWPLHARNMRLERNKVTGELEYEYDYNSVRHIMKSREVFHLRGFFTGGLVGMGLVEAGKNPIGNSLAGDKLAGAFFKNGNVPSAVIERPVEAKGLKPEAEENVLKRFTIRHGGPSKAFRLMMLQEGMTWKTISVNPKDSQLIEARTFQINEVARVFNIPPHMLKELTRSTNNNIEHQGIEFLTYTLGPWLIRAEQRCNKDLLSGPAEQAKYYVKFNVNALLRTDMQKQFEAYGTLWDRGVFSANDIREKLDMNPREDKYGDMHVRPLNYVYDEDMGALPKAIAEADAAPRSIEIPIKRTETRAVTDLMRLRLRDQWRPVIADVCTRLVKREAADIRAAYKKHMGQRSESDFIEWLHAYQEEFPNVARKLVGPALTAYAEAIGLEAAREINFDQAPDITEFTEKYIEAYAKRHSGSSVGQLEQILRDTPPEDQDDAINKRLDDWEETRGDKDADREVTQLNGGASRAAWLLLGITKFQWMAVGESCPFCENLSGRIVGVEQSFISSGETKTVGEQSITYGHNVYHPQAHQGCDCALLAVV